MCHNNKIFTFFIFTTVITLATFECQSEQINWQYSKNYDVQIGTDSLSLKYRKKKENKHSTLPFKLKIIKIETAEKHDLIAIHFNSKYLTKRFIVVNLEDSGKFTGYLNDVFEKTWSENYAFLKTDSSFLIIPNNKLKGFFNNSINQDSIVEIKGHPLGEIYQCTWEDENYLLYATSVDEMECWGVLELGTKSNYLIGCCGVDVLKINTCNTEKPWIDRFNEFKRNNKIGIKCEMNFYNCIYNNIK